VAGRYMPPREMSPWQANVNSRNSPKTTRTKPPNGVRWSSRTGWPRYRAGLNGAGLAGGGAKGIAREAVEVESVFSIPSATACFVPARSALATVAAAGIPGPVPHRSCSAVETLRTRLVKASACRRLSCDGETVRVGRGPVRRNSEVGHHSAQSSFQVLDPNPGILCRLGRRDRHNLPQQRRLAPGQWSRPQVQH
jgi:hypothetical protein